MHLELPPLDVYLPSSQSEHTLPDVWPRCAEYLPGEHAVHWDSSVAPWAELYMPVPQAMHDPLVI